ncbi:hypothetical protein OJF2_75060 [Aquisphaera giovannonii]|uniref:Uncharacterized protein n=1 Tax=Aquisphaera giovannonii TaxID=406548 RepID=A0A5B9WE29_9BACT|nr:hypothetical protein [Aquisphaera giovannonii]QEH38896.1 hypothetical protein OJF2_75060 [Aquisphaera giovannonii]
MIGGRIVRGVQRLRVLAGPAGMVLVLSAFCGVAGANEPVPEIDAGTMSSALSLLCGGLLILTGRRRRA